MHALGITRLLAIWQYSGGQAASKELEDQGEQQGSQQHRSL